MMTPLLISNGWVTGMTPSHPRVIVPPLAIASRREASSSQEFSRKLAVTVLLPFIVMAIVLLVSLASQFQAVNKNPGFATALTVTVAPFVYCKRSGSRLIEPPAPATEVRRH